MDFNALIDPSTTLGAFVISVVASLVVGFLSGKTYGKYINKNIINIQKNKKVEGDANVGCTIKRENDEK